MTGERREEGIYAEEGIYSIPVALIVLYQLLIYFLIRKGDWWSRGVSRIFWMLMRQLQKGVLILFYSPASFRGGVIVVSLGDLDAALRYSFEQPLGLARLRAL